MDTSIALLVSSTWGSTDWRDIQNNTLSIDVHNKYIHVLRVQKYTDFVAFKLKKYMEIQAVEQFSHDSLLLVLEK